MSDPRRHIRCPVCGKMAAADKYDTEQWEHELQEAEQHFVGKGRGGFHWEVSDASGESLQILEGALQVALGRVQQALVDLGVEPNE